MSDGATDDVMRTLCEIVGKAELGELYDETDCDWKYFIPEVSAVLDALRADPELAAAALGGDVRDHAFGIDNGLGVMEMDRLSMAELLAEEGEKIVTAPIIRGSWREVTE